MNPKVDSYLEIGCGRCKYGGTPQCKVHFWEEELVRLRLIALDSGLTEDVKWGVPCYTLNNKNILIIAAFKDYCTISFFKGSLLRDQFNLLTSPGEHSQSTKYLRLTSLTEIDAIEDKIRLYIQEAISNEIKGKKVDFKKSHDIEWPIELEEVFNKDLTYKTAFLTLTPGRQRSYLLHFSSAKQSTTRVTRILTSRNKVFLGKGFNEY